MKTICSIVVAGLVALANTVALANNDGFVAPELEGGSDWRTWVLSLVFLAGIAALAFRNARRTQMG